MVMRCREYSGQVDLGLFLRDPSDSQPPPTFPNNRVAGVSAPYQIPIWTSLFHSVVELVKYRRET